MAVGRIARETPDEALVVAARAGDGTAFSVLVGRYRDAALAYAFARLRDREEAEDVAQETFVRAYLALDRLRQTRSWEAWLMRILRNLCRDCQRRQSVRRTEPIDTALLEGEPSAEILALAKERRRELGAAVAKLPEKYRVPLLMHFASGRTYREIAWVLGLPESTIVGRMEGALRLLRRGLGVKVSAVKHKRAAS
jgi:RNA polymerase sigma-70 factor, ECF subfamily